MKLFDKKEEKSKVGRPKLADNETKKKAFIMLGISLVLVAMLLSGGLVSLNIMPNFNRLKGEVNTSLCSEIPARFQPYDEVNNPEGLHEYGFTEPKFYSAVVSTYNSDASYCSTITEDQLKSISSLVVHSRSINNADGVQYLEGLKNLDLSGDIYNRNKGELTSIDVSHNTVLKYLDISYNKLTSIDVSHNTELKELRLYDNNLNSIDLSHNMSLEILEIFVNNLSNLDVSHNTALTELSSGSNKLTNIDVSHNTLLTKLHLSFNELTNIDVSHNTVLKYLDISYNKLTSIDVSHNTALTELSSGSNKLTNIDVSHNTLLKKLYLSFNELTNIDVSHNTALTNLNISSNNLANIDLSHNTALTDLSMYGVQFEKTYSSLGKNITIEQPNIITAYPDDVIYSIRNPEILTYNDGLVEKLKTGSTTLYIKYKISPSLKYSINYTINFVNINSTSYTIDEEKKTVDLNGKILSDVSISEFSINTTNCSLTIKDDKLEIKDRNGIIDTYTFINYKLYALTSIPSIDEEKKIIDLNGGILSDVSSSLFFIRPSSYKLNINNDKLEIKDSSGTIVETYKFKNYSMYKLTSTSYRINEEGKTIDLNKELLNNVYISKFSIRPSSFKLNINNDKLEIKDSSGTIVETYKFKNYTLYKLTSTSYRINEEEKTIDLNKELLNNVSVSKFSISPYDYGYGGYRLKVNNDKLEIKDSSGNIVETYKFINYSKYKLNSYAYTIDNNTKKIDAKGNIFVINNIWINSSGRYDKRQNGNIIEILDSDKNVVDSYEIINEREKDSEAYLKAGFKDKNLYTCVVRSYADSNYDDMNEKSEYISGDYLLTDEDMQNIENLYCINKNVSDTTGIEKLANLGQLVLPYNNIETIDLSKNTNLYALVLGNNKLTSLDVSKNPNLGHLEVPNNKIEKIKELENLEGLGYLFVYNNNLSILDLSKTTNLEFMMVSNNLLTNTLYILKGKEIDYKKDFKLNEVYEIKYDVVDKGVASYKNSNLKALKEGITNIYLSNENIYVYKPELWDKNMECGYLLDQKVCEELENINEEEALLPYLINQEVKVYDVISKEYKIDKDKKIIDALNKDFDASKINLTLNGLTGTLENDKFIIKDKDVIVDIYTVTNIKKVVKEEVVSTSSNGTKEKPEMVEKANEKVINNIAKRNEEALKDVKLEDIIIEGENIPLATLLLVKGKDRNIIVKNDGITITINGKGIDNISSNLDLSYEIKLLKESLIYEDVKDKVKEGIVLSFKGNSNLANKILIEIEVTDKIKKSIGTKDLYLYNYDSDKMTLIADKINPDNNKLSFYINKLGNYVLTKTEANKMNVDIDKSMYEENTKLSKDINNKKLIKPLIIFILLIILGIIGYVAYKKNKEK